MPDTSTEVAIATTTLGSAQTSITFSSIPSTYTDLRLVMVGTGTVGGGLVALQFNGDTTTTYSYTTMLGNGTAASSSRLTTVDNINVAPNWSISSTVPALVEVDIFSYAGSTNKTLLSKNSSDANGSGYTQQVVGLWRSTATINSIRLFGDTFGIGTTATLYGIL